MRTNSLIIKTQALLLSAIALLLAGIEPGYGVVYTSRNLKISAPRINGVIGEKMTASGNVTVTSPELTLKAATVTWFFDTSGGIKSLEASGAVTFHLTNTSPAGALITADGEGDKLVYLPLENKATITVAAGKKAHIHSIEQLPLPAGATPGSARPIRNYDIKATAITFNSKDRSFEAEGGVEMEAGLPENPAPAIETPKPETQKP
jgi:lipopolysaccharide export system protein LptA